MEIPEIAFNAAKGGIQVENLKKAKFPPTKWSYTPRDCIRGSLFLVRGLMLGRTNAFCVQVYNLGLGAKAEELQYVFELNDKFHVVPSYAAIPGMLGVGTVTRYMPQFLTGFNVGTCSGRHFQFRV